MYSRSIDFVLVARFLCFVDFFVTGRPLSGFERLARRFPEFITRLEAEVCDFLAGVLIVAA